MNIVYQLTKDGVLKQYGIMALSLHPKRSCLAAPFLKDLRQARRLVNYLNQTQYPIDDFCDQYLDGTLLSLLKKKKSPA